jgi:hypothetical protein
MFGHVYARPVFGEAKHVPIDYHAGGIAPIGNSLSLNKMVTTGSGKIWRCWKSQILYVFRSVVFMVDHRLENYHAVTIASLIT